mmetsp:Transcript_2160/g.8434  ORF Transcript_2160/g.8434 Transcript_2160/m.8434 type:complete len:327 (+) Transcript_2160:18-998(+)
MCVPDIHSETPRCDDTSALPTQACTRLRARPATQASNLELGRFSALLLQTFQLDILNFSGRLWLWEHYRHNDTHREGAANDDQRIKFTHMEPRIDDELHPNQHKNRRHAVLHKSEVPQQPREHEVHGPQAEHREGRGREVDEGAVVLGDFGRHGIHREQHIHDLQHHDHEQQERAPPDRFDASGANGAGTRGRTRSIKFRVNSPKDRWLHAMPNGLLPIVAHRHAHEKGAIVIVGVGEGQAAGDEQDTPVLPRVIVVVVGEGSFVATVNQHQCEKYLRCKSRSEDVAAKNVEKQSQHNCTNDAEKQGLVDLAWRSGISGEDDMEEE